VIDGRFRRVRELGRGGLGEVFEAEDTRTGRRVAIKQMLPQFRALDGAAQRFEREAQAGGFTRHPNLVDVSELGRLEDGSLYLVMELIDGQPLGKVIDGRPLAAPRALALVRAALVGLRHAHQMGLVHRDLKPDNLMVTTGSAGETVKILDFGMVKLMGIAEAMLGSAKLTETGIVFGTPLYIAPEQAQGRPVDARADLYAMTVILFEALTGRTPFHGQDAREVMVHHVSTPAPTLLSTGIPVPARLESIVAKGLKKSPKDRWADAAEMIAALDAASR
jgi:serine/threonine-protein kinase